MVIGLTQYLIPAPFLEISAQRESNSDKLLVPGNGPRKSLLESIEGPI